MQLSIMVNSGLKAFLTQCSSEGAVSNETNSFLINLNGIRLLGALDLVV